MKLLKRLFGICETPLPADSGAWGMDDGGVKIDLRRTPELRQPGGAVRLEGRGLDPRLLVFRGDDGRLHAVANRCSHMGRRIDVIVGANTLACCSVGRSTFSYAGRPLGGAAKQPIRVFPLTVRGEELHIDLKAEGPPDE